VQKEGINNNVNNTTNVKTQTACPHCDESETWLGYNDYKVNFIA
jgi:hypothetical protein